jgi:hypothetical protein
MAEPRVLAPVARVRFLHRQHEAEVAQLAEALRSTRRGCGFDSRAQHDFGSIKEDSADIAQLEEASALEAEG